MPQLDALRAFAFAVVALQHWRPSGFDLPLVSGVHLFFVLSGFLITGILLDTRTRDESGAEGNLVATLRTFYARRFLRIVPLYYAALAIATYFDVAGLRQSWPWHAAYLSNYQVFFKDDWIGMVGHFWTLAVEEQFYLAWPFLVLCLPQRLLPTAFLAVATGSVLFRLIGEYWFAHRTMWNLATPGYLDTFALGALLAYARRAPLAGYELFVRWRGTIIMACLLLACLRMWVFVGWRLVYLDPLLMAVAYSALISLAADGVRGPLGWLLNRPPLLYVGKISYGLYIAHNFAFIPMDSLLAQFPELLVIPKIRYLLMATWTLGVAMLSWHFYEAPINALKRYFPYVKGGTSAPAPLSAARSSGTGA